LSKPRNGLIAALDLGTTKVCCFVARTDGNAWPRVIGIGHQVSKGVRSGTIVDSKFSAYVMTTRPHFWLVTILKESAHRIAVWSGNPLVACLRPWGW